MVADIAQAKRRTGLAQLFSDLTQRTAPIATAATGGLGGSESTLAGRAASIYGTPVPDASRPAPAASPERSRG